MKYIVTVLKYKYSAIYRLGKKGDKRARLAESS